MKKKKKKRGRWKKKKKQKKKEKQKQKQKQKDDEERKITTGQNIHIRTDGSKKGGIYERKTQQFVGCAK